MNLQRARELRAAFPAGVPGATQPLRLRVDASGDLFKLIGERVAVNARQANLLVQLPEYAGVRANVHNWNASPWGDWRLADVWLDSEDAVTTKAPTSPQKNSSTARNPGARP